MIAAVLLVLALVGGDSLPERVGPPIEELAVERTTLEPNLIELSVRNTGPDDVTVAQAFVNDAYVDFSGAEGAIGRLGSETIALAYPWQEGQPYLISLVTSTGAVIEHEIPVAVETPETDGDLFALMALLGVYVGVIPVALGDAAVAGDAPVQAELDARADGRDGRTARLPRRRRDPGGARARRHLRRRLRRRRVARARRRALLSGLDRGWPLAAARAARPPAPRPVAPSSR